MLEYGIRLYGAPMRWHIDEYEPPRRFIDSQMSGPYAYWRHTHLFEDVSKDTTIISDLVEYRMPLGLLGEIAHAVFVAQILQQIFDFRATEIKRLFGLALKRHKPLNWIQRQMALQMLLKHYWRWILTDDLSTEEMSSLEGAGTRSASNHAHLLPTRPEIGTGAVLVKQ